MTSLFKKILIPVDFSEGSKMAIRKATQLAEPAGAAICLLYICKPLFSMKIFSSTGYLVAPATEILTISEIESRIREYKSYIYEHLDNVMVETMISESGKIEDKIVEASDLFGPDLIVVYKKSGKAITHLLYPVSSERIAQKTDCPVLTIKEGSEEKAIRNIILPVTLRIPARKLDIAIKLAKVFGAKIHLISFTDDKGEEEKSDHAFIESFKKIRENASLIVKHGPVSGNNFARAILKYAVDAGADMILVNPVTESSLHYIMGRIHISDLLSRYSPIQILDIKPYSLTN